MPVAGVIDAFEEIAIVGTSAANSSFVAPSITLKAILPVASSITGCSVTIVAPSNTKLVIFASELSEPVNLVPLYTTLTFWPNCNTSIFRSASTFPLLMVPATSTLHLPMPLKFSS